MCVCVPVNDPHRSSRQNHAHQSHREEKEKRERQEIEEKNKLAAARKAELLAQLKALEEGVEDGSSKVRTRA